MASQPEYTTAVSLRLQWEKNLPEQDPNEALFVNLLFDKHIQRLF